MQTPNGIFFSMAARDDTADGAIATGIMAEDEYHLRGRHWSGWAIDIGAYTGVVSLALAVDNPQLKVIAVEPVPDNADLIRQSVAANGLGERVFVEEASAGPIGVSSLPCHYAYTDVGIPDKGYVAQNRFVGNLWREGVDSEGTVISSPVVTTEGLMAKYGIDDFSLVKIDCEGCEWPFLRTGAEHMAEIVGEWHDRPFSAIGRLLGKTHRVELLTDYGGSGIFRALRK